MNAWSGFGSACGFVLGTTMVGCATYETAGLANELTLLRQNLPSEMLWMNDWKTEPWRRGHATAKVNIDIVEYVRPPETIQNWTEMLTMIVEWKMSKADSHAGGTTISEVPSPTAMADAVRVAAQNRCAEPVSFQILGENKSAYYPSTVFYLACGKFKESSPSVAEAQVQHVFQGKHAMHTVIRAKRAASLDKATLDAWTQYIARFYVCDNKISGQECGAKKSFQF